MPNNRFRICSIAILKFRFKAYRSHKINLYARDCLSLIRSKVVISLFDVEFQEIRIKNIVQFINVNNFNQKENVSLISFTTVCYYLLELSLHISSIHDCEAA